MSGWKSFMVLSVGAPLIFLPACSDDRSATRVGDHSFAIPRENLVMGNIFYLPASQNRGLRFVINPKAPQERRILVSIDPESECPQEYAVQRSESCKAVAIPTGQLEHDTFKRVSPNGEPWWEYRSKRLGLTVAACTALVNKTDGLCTSYGLYGDLPYTVHLRDSDIKRLIAVRKGVEQKLSDWDLHQKDT